MTYIGCSRKKIKRVCENCDTNNTYGVKMIVNASSASYSSNIKAFEGQPDNVKFHKEIEIAKMVFEIIRFSRMILGTRRTIIDIR